MKPNKLLIVIDMQNDFVDGSLGTEQAKMIVPNIVNLIRQHKQETGENPWYTMDTHDQDYLNTHEGKYLPVKHCVCKTEGWQITKAILDEIEKTEYSYRIYKSTFGSSTLIDEIYDGKYSEIILCGLCTDICVVSNALILRSEYPETDITVYADCCAGVTPEKHEAALDVMESCQITVLNRGKEPWKIGEQK